MAPAVLDRPQPRSEPSYEFKKGDAPLFEVVQGKIVELPNTSSYSSQISNRLYISLFRHIELSLHGTLLFETLFGIPSRSDPGKQRRPDLAYISANRWPLTQRAPDTDPWPAVPNLAVEVLSPNDRIQEVESKIHEYFEAGVELVWVVNPRQETVSSYTSPRQVTILGKADTLSAGEVIPGFALPLSQLFRS